MSEREPGLSGSSAAWVCRGVLAALALPAWTVALALLGVGSLARDAGHPVAAAVLSTLLIWAGPAQVLFYAGLAAGMAPVAIAAVVGFSSIRFLPMTIAVLPLLRTNGRGERTTVGALLYAAHFNAVTVWTESLRRLPDLPERARFPFYMGFAHACILLTAVSTGLGYFLMGALPLPLAAGLLFLTPIFFTVSAAAGARQRSEWAAIGLGLVLEGPVRGVMGDSIDLLVVGLLGGTAAWLLQRQRSTR